MEEQGTGAPAQITCTHCDQKAIEGANYCHMCGHLLPAPEGEEPKLLTCDSCGRKALPEAKFCQDCGQPLGAGHSHGEEEDAPGGERIACPDGACIGIRGPDGLCTDCGKPIPAGGA